MSACVPVAAGLSTNSVIELPVEARTNPHPSRRRFSTINASLANHVTEPAQQSIFQQIALRCDLRAGS